MYIYIYIYRERERVCFSFKAVRRFEGFYKGVYDGFTSVGFRARVVGEGVYRSLGERALSAKASAAI